MSDKYLPCSLVSDPTEGYSKIKDAFPGRRTARSFGTKMGAQVGSLRMKKYLQLFQIADTNCKSIQKTYLDLCWHKFRSNHKFIIQNKSFSQNSQPKNGPFSFEKKSTKSPVAPSWASATTRCGRTPRSDYPEVFNGVMTNWIFSHLNHRIFRFWFNYVYLKQKTDLK